MKVILCEDVDNLGSMGMTVKVAPGFARNYLLPRKMAVASDSASARQIEHEMRIIRKKEERLRTELTEVSKDIAKLQVDHFDPGHSKWDWSYVLHEQRPDVIVRASRGLAARDDFRRDYDFVRATDGVRFFLHRESRWKLDDPKAEIRPQPSLRGAP